MLKVGGQYQKFMVSISNLGQNLAKVGGRSPPPCPVDKCPGCFQGPDNLIKLSMVNGLAFFHCAPVSQSTRTQLCSAMQLQSQKEILNPLLNKHYENGVILRVDNRVELDSFRFVISEVRFKIRLFTFSLVCIFIESTTLMRI